MTTASVTVTPQARWQRELADAVRDPVTLLRRLGLEPHQVPGAADAARLFPVRVPEPYLQRMRRGDPDDPLLRQVLPVAAETRDEPGFTTDPLAEREAGPVPGVLHKYHGRALLITTGACAVHCRYCFRRHYPYAEAHAGRGRWRPALAALAADVSIGEVILSGGDPLSLSDEALGELLGGLAAIPHLQRLRLHTRLPVVIPSRVTDTLIDRLARGRLRPVVVLHANHARELDADVDEAAAALRSSGATLLNQAVLLRGVNDSADAQVALAERLFEAGVLPYYLHLLDPVAGAAHFDVPEAEAREIVAAAAARLPGYLVPRLAREEPGTAAKTVLAPGDGGTAGGPAR